MSIIYGVDTEQPITPIMVRDAIVRCFGQAHYPYEDNKNISRHAEELYAKPIVEKAFLDSGGDFEYPTKESLEKAVKSLIEFAKTFTDHDIIRQHTSEIQQLIEKIH